jgi:hypothetical protein
MSNDNPYQAPRVLCRDPIDEPRDAWGEVEPGYWLVLLASPFFVYGGMAIGAWLFA